jgi:hypothetical protein
VRGAFTQSYSFKFALAAVLLVVIAAVRLPFITNILAGEEGEFAVLVLNDVPISTLDDDHLPRELVGFIDGDPILISFHRTVMPYIILERLGRAFAVRHALGRLPPEKLTVAARLPFAIIFLIGSAGLVALTVRAATATGKRFALATATAPLAVTLWSLTTPLAVGASIEPQIDGSVGVLLLGTAATLLAVGNIEQSSARWRFLAAGLLAGLGKHEWALAFAAATLGTAMFCLLFLDQRKPAIMALAAFLIGLVLTVALSYAVSPEDFRDGFDVMADFYSRTGGQLWALEKAQRPFTLPVAALVVIDGVFLVIVLRPLLRAAPGLFVAYLGASAITIGYTVSGWQGDFFPRYFAPPLLILAIVFVALWLRFKDAISPAVGWTIVAAALFGLAANYGVLAGSYDSKVSITSWRGTPLAELEQDYALAASLARNGRRIVYAFTPAWIYSQDINYISAGLAKSDAIELVTDADPAFKDRIAYPPDKMVYPPPPQ